MRCSDWSWYGRSSTVNPGGCVSGSISLISRCRMKSGIERIFESAHAASARASRSCRRAMSSFHSIATRDSYMTAPDAPSGDTPPYREYDELRSLQNMVDRS